jgi:peptidoglycan/LPS O-acetylase OafA/YrhL
MRPSEKTNASVEGLARVEVLDLLRMIAVLAVILFHYGYRGPNALGVADVALPEIAAFAKYGYLGVQLFFVISGFVIAYSAEGRTATAFAIARVARIYPGFLFCMTVTFFATLAFGAPRFDATVSQWVANLFIAAPALKQSYMDSAYWTIVYEVIFYAWIYLLIASGLFRRRIDVVVLIWLTLSLLNETALQSYAVRKIFLTDQSGFFAAGLLLYEMFKGRRDAALQCLFALATAGAVLQGLANVQWFREPFDDWTVASLCLASILAVMLAVRVRRVPLPAGVVLAIGGLTYPLYLLHQQVGYIALQRLAEVTHIGVLVLMIVTALVAASWAVWRYVERPVQRMVKSRLTQIARRLGLATDSSKTLKPSRAAHAA